MASAMCLTTMVGALSRSAIVRATFRMRSWARALRPCCVMARSSRRSQSAESSQNVRMVAGTHVGVAVELLMGGGEAIQLLLAGAYNARPDRGRAFRFGAGTHLFIV